jgi:hypothetical protein
MRIELRMSGSGNSDLDSCFLHRNPGDGVPSIMSLLPRSGLRREDMQQQTEAIEPSHSIPDVDPIMRSSLQNSHPSGFPGADIIDGFSMFQRTEIPFCHSQYR